MKKLIITLEYPPQIGGIATYVYNLASHLPAQDVVVYAPKNKNQEEFDAKNPWKTYRLNPYWGFVWPKWLRLFFQIITLVNQEKIEMLYVNHVLPVGYVAYLVKKFKKIPYTLFLHGTDIATAVANKSKRKKFIKLCKEAKTVVVNSEFLKSKLSDVVENLSDVRVVYPCPSDLFFDTPVDELEISTLRARLALGGKKVILTVARMVEGKGFPHMIRMLPEILKKVPNAVWLVIGDGPKSKEIFAMVQKNSLQNVARFLGNIEPKDLLKYYRLADLFVLLTHKDENHEEGWGTVFLEAAACGLPVVAGRVGGVEEAVLDGETGMVVDVYQDQSVVPAIVGILTNQEVGKQMGQTGKVRADNSFRWSQEVSKLL
ncbi:MAG: glycosyltransferase family 4 protein [Candidatus Magasanikbacteria bacterium]